MTSIEIVDVAARDGLQNESVFLDTATKISLIEQCTRAGIDRMEVASFVNPKLVPQMADAESVVSGLSPQSLERSIGLVLNERGIERAMESKIPEINFVVVATDTFAHKNQGVSTNELVDKWHRVAQVAKDAGIRTSVVISAAFGCPYEGEVDPARVLELVSQVLESGPDEVGLADTIGSGTPREVEYLVKRTVSLAGGVPVRCHFHNTRNTGLANAYVAVNHGASALDASLGGIGGCPFAPRATGNIPTEDVVWMLQRSGFEVRADVSKLIDTSKWLGEQLGRETPSLLSRAGIFPPPAQHG